ncbi:MAG: hypothetical protein ABSB94_10720 [Syntrophorhabdales bacterium]|jgi:hypothetical protein
MVLTKQQELFAWPPRCRISVYQIEEGFVIWPPEVSTERLFDLSESIDFPPNRKRVAVHFGLSTKSVRWPIWDERRLQQIEWRIKYDLEFEGYEVTIKRLGEHGSPCFEEFLWKLSIRDRRCE